MIGLNDIKEAGERLKAVLANTPIAYGPFLSQMCGMSVFLKKENLQIIGSFKLRGAFNRIATLSRKERERGVITASAGNHAQGVAFAARYFGIRSFIAMPDATPLLKVNATKEMGAKVLLYGLNYDEAYFYAENYCREHDLSFIHPFADDGVIAGQGTLALEMLDAAPDLDAILVPVGGGGLISGVAVGAKAINPKIKIIGVNASGANSAHSSFIAKKPVNSASVRTIADGIAVRDCSPLTLEYILKYVDEIIEVDDEEIASAILFLIEKQKLVVEGAGAVGVAALMHKKSGLKQNSKVGVILSGGNIDVTMLSVIIEKGLIKASRKMNLVVTLIDKPGSLQKLSTSLSSVKANIVQIDYDRTAISLDYGDAYVSVSLETKGAEHQDEIRSRLKDDGFVFSET
jgi:threonine dehydratase